MIITLAHGIPFLTGPGYVSDQHGCVYGIIDDALFFTPQFSGGGYSTDEDDWAEVDHMAMLGEDGDVRLHIEWVEDMLRRENEGIFADPARM